MQCDAEKLFKEFLGDKDVEVILQGLDQLTQDEARIAAAQALEVVYDLIQNMRVVMDGKQILWAIRWLGVENPYL
jgi:hypothetical protein